MSQILTELLEANRKYCGGFGDRANLAVPPAERFRDSNLYGCPAGSVKVRGLVRRRCARNS